MDAVPAAPAVPFTAAVVLDDAPEVELDPPGGVSGSSSTARAWPLLAERRTRRSVARTGVPSSAAKLPLSSARLMVTTGTPVRDLAADGVTPSVVSGKSLTKVDEAEEEYETPEPSPALMRANQPIQLELDDSALLMSPETRRLVDSALDLCEHSAAGAEGEEDEEGKEREAGSGVERLSPASRARLGATVPMSPATTRLLNRVIEENEEEEDKEFVLDGGRGIE